MSANDLAAALAVRIAPLLAQSVPGNRLHIRTKGGHLNILQEDAQAEQGPADSKVKKGHAAEPLAKSSGSRATADAQGAKKHEPGGLGQPCCQPLLASVNQQGSLPSSRAGADSGKASTGNRGPEAGPGPGTQRSAVRCKADLQALSNHSHSILAKFLTSHERVQYPHNISVHCPHNVHLLITC